MHEWMDRYPKAKTRDGRTVTVCYCNGGPAHEWKPNGGGARILACPSFPHPASSRPSGAVS